MTLRKSIIASGLVMSATCLCSFEWSVTAKAQELQPAPIAAPEPMPECNIDLTLTGKMSDIVSNALVRGFKRPPAEVSRFLDRAEEKYENGQALLKAAAADFNIAEDALAAKVEKYKHCNCSHPVPSALHPLLLVDTQPHPDCQVDFELTGNMSDILSNALMLGLSVPELDVAGFLAAADEKFEDGPEVFKLTAAQFKLSEDVLAVEAQKFKHCNCKHGLWDGQTGTARAQQVDDGLPVSAFAKDVTVHVVLHELGHALVREFDLPVLNNEETMADAFATYYLTTYMPDRALDILTARTTSLMIEAGEATEIEWGGEHDHDARRAHQIAALAVAADSEKYKPVAAIIGMSEKDIKKACDYGSEIHRSWRRVLAPLWMPEGAASSEARVVFDESKAFLVRLCDDGLANEIGAAVRRFDWHSQVTVRFIIGEGGARWSRSDRTITVNSAYVRRFIDQGNRGFPPQP